jgi:protein tyrosine/serine phosphatase
MGKDILYRTASPIDPVHKRNTYADAACKKYGIATVMNLSDSEETAKSFPDYDKTYYSTTDYIPLDMGVNFDSDDFREKLAEGLRFFAEHKGPYAVHCTEGKDRAGTVAALLECLMGASYDEVVSDYMVTYYNYYGITPDDERYETIVRDNIEATLKTMYKTDDLRDADLVAEAEEYCRETGLSDEEITALKSSLSGETAGRKDRPGHTAFAVLIAALFAGLLAADVFRKKKRAGKS